MATTKRQRGKKIFSSSAILTIALLIVAGILAAQLYMMWRDGTLGGVFSSLSKTATLPKSGGGIPPAPTPTPTMTPLPQGRQEYTVSQGSAAKGPFVSKIILDTNDPKTGQTFTIRVAGRQRNASITEIRVVERNDKGEETHVLSQASGNASQGEWEGTWTIANDHTYTYNIIVTAVDQANEQTVVDLAFRRP